jgi:hypothetical protein
VLFRYGGLAVVLPDQTMVIHDWDDAFDVVGEQITEWALEWRR